MAAASSWVLSSPALTPKPFSLAFKPCISISIRNSSVFSSIPPCIRLHIQRNLPFSPCSAVQDIPVVENEARDGVKKEEEEEEDGDLEKRRKLYVANIPWSYSAPDIVKLFSECGTVKDVEIIKQKNGKSRGFAFVTMASGEEAHAVVQKFDAYELAGRVIRVEFSKSFRKPAPPPPPGSPRAETRYKIYVGNLAWKVRSVNLKDFFSQKFNPVGARVVFDSPSGKSTGYGFVSFATMEEAQAAVKELDGKELMERPLRLRIGQKNEETGSSEPEEEDNSEEQTEES
ncbi:Splicing factor 3b subunit 4 protein [Dioscorea alata]|uniref:Splicing factor 3b subunit 4 protein n=1 Tax=Dioscorea alata TaxID=55571 RepID=A0ACB7WHY9_DIOAL|nr:Splicing factor 3b subunit 4 protein [Dioscorea alata]